MLKFIKFAQVLFPAVMDGFIADETTLQKAGEAAGNYVKQNAGATDVVLKGVSL